jgi:hypothetical protein
MTILIAIAAGSLVLIGWFTLRRVARPEQPVREAPPSLVSLPDSRERAAWLGSDSAADHHVDLPVGPGEDGYAAAYELLDRN